MEADVELSLPIEEKEKLNQTINLMINIPSPKKPIGVTTEEMPSDKPYLFL